MGDFFMGNAIDKNKRNVTKYGEFVCTFDEWLPLDKQKENAEKLENITNDKDN